MASSKRSPGFLFMFGIYGTTATRETVQLLKETGACGVLLLARNIESPAQTRRLISELQDKVGRPLLFSVDHEGGWVLRFSSGVTPFPGNAALGRIGDPELAYAQGRQMAMELRRLGIQINLAPVLDVVTKKYNPGIGIRSFGSDPELVGKLGAAFIRGQQDHGVSACAKHFPGKGAATQDAHVTLSTIRMPLKEFRNIHLHPFQEAVDAGVDCVMTSHVMFPSLDKKKIPATFSPKITGRLLRRDLGFKGAVLSDDLCMGAVTERWPIQEAAVLSLKAGHDILLIAHEKTVQWESAGLVAAALAEGRISRAQYEASVRRIEHLLEKHKKNSSHPSLSYKADEGNALAQQIADGAVEISHQGITTVPLPLGAPKFKRIAVLWPKFKEVRDRFTFEDGPEGALRRMRERLSQWPAKTTLIETPILEGGPAAEKTVRKAQKGDAVIFFCFEAMRFPGQMDVLKRLQARLSKRLIVCLIRNPWDQELLSPQVTAVNSYSYRDSSIQALLHTIYPA